MGELGQEGKGCLPLLRGGVMMCYVTLLLSVLEHADPVSVWL